MSRKPSGGRGKPGSGRRRPDRITFLIDECLGGAKLARDLREAGAEAHRLEDHFLRGCKDVDWIPVVAKRRWVILTQDVHVTRRELELAKLEEHAAIAFVLTTGDLTGEQISRVLVGALPRIERILRRYRRPIVYFVSRSGDLKRHMAKRRKKRGRPPTPKRA